MLSPIPVAAVVTALSNKLFVNYDIWVFFKILPVAATRFLPIPSYVSVSFTIDDISSSDRFNIELMSETLIPNTLLNAFATTLLSSVFYDISLRYPTMDSNSLFTEDLSSPLCKSSA